jgi:hypothetical protein
LRGTTGPADRPCSLLRLILRGMRQRALVIIKPNQIPRIDPAVAYFASEKVIGLANATSVGALAEYRPARSRFIEWHDRCHLAPVLPDAAPDDCYRG